MFCRSGSGVSLVTLCRCSSARIEILIVEFKNTGYISDTLSSGSGVSLVTLCRGVCYPDALVLRLKFLYFAAIQPVFNYGIQEYHTL